MSPLRTVRTPRKRQLVLDAIAKGLTAAEAAAAAGMGRRALFQWKADDAEFAADYAAAYAAGTDCYEAEARRRAFDESDVLLIFLLKSRDPQRFARKLIAVGGDPDAPPIGVEVDERVHFFMPSNHRDQPEVLDDEAPIIEGDAEPEGEDGAA